MLDGGTLSLFDRQTARFAQIARSSRRTFPADVVSVSVTPDGRWVVFAGPADLLAGGTPCSGPQQCTAIYVKDMRSGSLKDVTIPPSGESFPGVASGARADDGARFVTFWSARWMNQYFGRGRSSVYVRDLTRAVTSRIPR